MVKNVHGGNKHKSQGRKFTTAKASSKLRIAENEGELYSIVIKMLGNGMFHAYCIDGIVRLGQIRGKFSGRGKRDNFVEVGKWVLVGEREWDIQSNADKTKNTKLKCDLLEVYNDLDKERLTDTVRMDWSILISQDVTKSKDVGYAETDVIFQTQREEECEKLLNEINVTKPANIDLELNNEEMEAWDDI
jgi:initiation factor 1A